MSTSADLALKPSQLHALSDAAGARLSALQFRKPFIRYAEVVLNVVCGTCRLQQDGLDLQIDSFRLRSSSKVRPWAASKISPKNDPDPQKTAYDALLSITVPEDEHGPLYEGRWLLKLDGQKLRGSWQQTRPTNNDFVFRYPIFKPACKPESMAEFWAAIVATLLDAFDLYSGETRVCPDKLFLGALSSKVSLAPPLDTPEFGKRSDGRNGTGERQPLHSIVATEPSIATLARHWGLLASTLQNDRAFPVRLEGFRLRSTEDWLVPSAGDPADVYEYLGRVCNVACKFCYLYGNPDDLAIARGTHVVSKGEIETRLKYFDPDAGQALFQADWESNETLIDPKLTYVLKTLRKKTNRPFFFVTNGSPLTPSIVSVLAEAQPVHVIVSLNTSDPELRAAVMGERKRQTHQALDSLRLLSEAKISFGVSLAAFPDFPFSDLSKTIARIEEYLPAFVRVNLPGFSKYLLPETPFDTVPIWKDVIDWAKEERKKTKIPIITIPSAFEENNWYERANTPRVIGVIPNSPAFRAGVVTGDQILEINGNPIQTRSAAQSLLSLTSGFLRLNVSHNGNLTPLILDASDAEYPYVGESYGKYRFPWGIVLAPSLSYSDAFQIRAALENIGPDADAWMFTSNLMLPAAKELFELYLDDIEDRIRFIVPSNDYLGGNIMVLDMCSVGDLSRCLSNEIKNAGRKPRLLIIPSSGFNIHGRDITGRHFGDIERYFGVSIAMIECTRFVF